MQEKINKMKPQELHNYLVHRAGISNSDILKGKEDIEFEHILYAFKAIHRGKEYLYGSYSETHCKDPKLFALTTYYADIKRKFVRFENIVKKMNAGEDIAIEELFDTISDMGVYSAMGIQLLNYFSGLENKQQDLGLEENHEQLI